MPAHIWPTLDSERQTITYELPDSFQCLGLRTVVLKLDPEGDNYHETDVHLNRAQLLANLPFILSCCHRREQLLYPDGEWPPGLLCNLFVNENVAGNTLGLHIIENANSLCCDYPSDSDDEDNVEDWRSVVNSGQVCYKRFSDDDISKILNERFTEVADYKLRFNCRKSSIMRHQRHAAR